jgi:hypothetical protein
MKIEHPAMLGEKIKHPLRKFSTWLKILFGALAAYCLVLYVGHRNQYCFSQWRFMSEAELVPLAIDDELRFLQRKKAIYGHVFVQFKDREEFLKLNPDCCKIVHGDEEITPYELSSWTSMTIGFYGSAIQLKYKLKTREVDGKIIERNASPFVILDACGGLREKAVRVGAYDIDD